MADASNPFPVLPQNQGDYYDLQRKMMIAQALQQQAMTPLSEGEQGWNQMRIVPRTSGLSAVAKMGQALLGGYMSNKALDAQRQFGQEQWQSMQNMFQPQPSTQYQNQPDASGNPQGVLTGGAMPTKTVTQQPSSMNPGNLNPQTAAMLYMRDPSGYAKDFIAPYAKPTDATLAAMQSNGAINPGQANVEAFAKSANIAPPEGRPGGYTYLPQVGPKGQVTYKQQFNQPIEAGGRPLYDQNGNIAAIGAMPGASGVAGQMAGGEAAGKGQYQLVTGVDANGNPTYRTVTDVATGNAGGGQGGSSNFPGLTGAGGGTAGGGFAPSLPAGSEGLIKGFTDRYQQGQDAAKNAPQDIQAFRAIDQAASQSKTGVGFDRAAAWKSMASVIPGVSPDNPDKVNADIIHKYNAQIASRNGGRSDAALESAANSITNGGMSPAAIHELTPSLIGGRMSDLGRSNAATSWMQAHGGAPASLGEFEHKWNQSYDPDAYRLQAMTPSQQQQFIQSLPAQRRAAILQSRQQLRSLGALPDMGQ